MNRSASDSQIVVFLLALVLVTALMRDLIMLAIVDEAVSSAVDLINWLERNASDVGPKKV
jgi:hypothetical protein